MAEISAGMVKELRELTGLGMMECKKALAEAAGNDREGERELPLVENSTPAVEHADRKG